MLTPFFEWFLSMSEILEISEHSQKALLSEAVRIPLTLLTTRHRRVEF